MQPITTRMKGKRHETLPRNIEENHETWIVFNDGSRDERVF